MPNRVFSGVRHNPKPTTPRGQRRARRKALNSAAHRFQQTAAYIYGENETARRKERLGLTA